MHSISPFPYRLAIVTIKSAATFQRIRQFLLILNFRCCDINRFSVTCRNFGCGCVVNFTIVSGHDFGFYSSLLKLNPTLSLSLGVKLLRFVSVYVPLKRVCHLYVWLIVRSIFIFWGSLFGEKWRKSHFFVHVKMCGKITKSQVTRTRM